ncbi:hypothetical protein C2G38_2244572 [Gigaspora rosea]|uniref:Myb-like domain-containing protein n=1 Tax=Gigaspora rosea TaxID=44941 RepID=A0A397VF28_9GLOM|nr:hypothetical protein C2G38_2244572 [Gigaspora rosea]
MVEWTDSQIRILIDERRNRNDEYHNFGRNRIRFWDSIATRINQEHNTSFNGYQCKEKFINLVWDYKRPEDEFDRIRNINSSNRRRNRNVGNTTPAPPIEEVEHALSTRSSRPPPPIESLSPQPPHYSQDEDAIASGVTDEAQNNNQSQDSSNYEVAISSSNLTPDLLNLSLSRNESDISMPDIGGSQPPSCMENINEEN